MQFKPLDPFNRNIKVYHCKEKHSDLCLVDSTEKLFFRGRYCHHCYNAKMKKYYREYYSKTRSIAARTARVAQNDSKCISKKAQKRAELRARFNSKESE